MASLDMAGLVLIDDDKGFMKERMSGLTMLYTLENQHENPLFEKENHLQNQHF